MLATPATPNTEGAVDAPEGTSATTAHPASLPIPPLPLSSPAAALSQHAGSRSSPPVAEDQIENTLKCPICIDWFVEPILLDCSHSLCLDCARRLALHDSGSNTAEVTCPLCKEVTAISGGDKAREMEDALIAEA